MFYIKDYLIKLAYVNGMNGQQKWRVIHHLLTFKNERLTTNEIIEIAQIKSQEMTFQKSWWMIHEEWEKIKKEERFFTCLDPIYPSQLFHLAYPPILLFYKGDLSLLRSKMISVVGGRETSVLAKKTVNHLLLPVIEKGFVIVSGGAKGIDAYAHQAAIKASGRTIAIIGTGIDRCYPKENQRLQEEISKNHLLLSEFRPEDGPKKYHFPMRNRIIAALSQGICVVEAKKKSGSLITAQQGLELGRTIFSVPGNILTGQSSGCHHLIQDGAICAISGQDILAEING
ncbi:DNA protecting protein DprA [Enterococcus sp. 10A9_DIV0425]|uniref:DNA protecting protein DprA n=1 Tax=Candidatus Enterococcus wittei TaxID=1987383 RepID=A0A2C9XRT8_9ENTE|nr:DNA-processing protein DprA [Enterococcus sp. 10A9_DIV0425]OTP12124.1 DNA protecting protein DprA [Enterococcus sp. 10A9_DIV0425]THE16100.1 DNA-protecting protein DprA [Enterococcus hirae]